MTGLTHFLSFLQTIPKETFNFPNSTHEKFSENHWGHRYGFSIKSATTAHVKDFFRQIECQK